MTFGQCVNCCKPYLTGIVVGLIAAPIIAFSAGWVSTGGARAEAVENARVDTLAGICLAIASRLAVTRSIDLAAIKGYDNRVEREALVAAAMGDIAIPSELARKVARGCYRALA